MKLNDRKIIAAVLAGRDESALKDLYRFIWPDIRKYIIYNKGKIEEAEDIFQDGLIILLKKIKMNEFNPEYQIKSYLFTICRNLWINKVKREKKLYSQVVTSEEVDVEGDDFFSGYFNNEKARVIVDVFNSIGEQCGKVLEYVFYYNLEMKDIANEMGFKSADVAKTIHYRCKQKLIQLIRNNPGLENYIRK